MPNLEELVKIRNESIEETEDLLKLIESYLKYYSYIYYNYVINREIEKDVKHHVLDDGIYGFHTNIISLEPYYIKEYENNKMFAEIIDKYNKGNISLIDIKNLLNLREDPILAIPQFEGRSAYYYVRKSYIEELVKADGLSIEYPDKENYPTFLQVTATLPKLELPKQKVLTDN